MKQELLNWVMLAHSEGNTRDAVRRFDRKTPYWLHPIGMAALLIQDEALPWEFRLLAAEIALLHDVREDTNFPLINAKPYILSDFDLVEEGVNLLTGETSWKLWLHFLEDPKALPDHVFVVKMADLCDNMSTPGALKDPSFYQKVFPAVEKELSERPALKGSIWPHRLRMVQDLLREKGLF